MDELKAERFQLITACLKNEPEPSARLREYARQPWFQKSPFSMLLALKNTAQSPVYHPEGNVWEHTMLVVDEAAKRRSFSRDPEAFLLAALLHDLGKPATTKIRGGKITAYGHDKKGAELTRLFLREVTRVAGLIDRVAWLVAYHMQILYVNRNLPFGDLKGMLEHTDLREAALLCYCDRMGRGARNPLEEQEELLRFLRSCGHPARPAWL